MTGPIDDRGASLPVGLGPKNGALPHHRSGVLVDQAQVESDPQLPDRQVPGDRRARSSPTVH